MNDPTPGIDEDLELWDQFITAVRWLRAHGHRPELTLTAAFEEALSEWIAEQAALHADGQGLLQHNPDRASAGLDPNTCIRAR